MHSFKILSLLLAFSLCFPVIDAMIEGLYCGVENCYDVLGVTRDMGKREIASAYRQRARKTHPDLFRDETEKEEAVVRFRALTTAYEILRDEDSRADYDYMLDNPDELYAHYYRYYRRRITPRVDIRIVLAVTISVISVFQYYTAHTRYEDAIRYLTSVPKYRIQAQQIAREEKLLDHLKKMKRLNKEEARHEEERVYRRIIEEKMDIRGGYSKPSWYNVLWVQLFLLPYTTWRYSAWLSRWLYKFTLLRQPYGEEEKLYLIRRNLKLSQTQFDSLEEDVIESYMAMELWVWERFSEWKQEQEEEARRKMAQSGQYKQYRRYMKNHGPGRMYFDD